VDDILNLVKTVDPGTFGDAAAADSPGQMKEFQGSLVIRQTRANHDKIRKLLSDLRSVSQKQVSIDVRFVQIDAAVLEQILFDVDIDVTNLIFGVTQRAQGSFLTYTSNGISGSGFGTGVGNPPLAVRGVTGSGIAQPATGGLVPAPADNPMFSQSGPHPVDLLAFNPSTGQSKDFGSSNAKILGNQSGMLLNGAVIDDVAVRFFLQATQASNRTAQFTSPKVTLLNGRKATIAVRSFQPYVANVKSNVGGGAGAVGVDPQIQLAENGTTMWVRAVVSHDNRFVTMQMNPILTITNLDQIQAFNVTGGGNAADNNVAGNNNIIQTPGVNIQQPRRFEQNIFTTVKVPDKGTVVLGGFKTSNEVERELGVPILSKIPVIKRMFANRSYGRDDSVLVILVKPTIHLYEEIDPFHDQRPGAR
jgi:type II secretory pathway component GspD/PulD (secretin)